MRVSKVNRYSSRCNQTTDANIWSFDYRVLIDRRIAMAWTQLQLLADTKDTWRHAMQYSMLIAPVGERNGSGELTVDFTLCIEQPSFSNARCTTIIFRPRLIVRLEADAREMVRHYSTVVGS